MVLQEIWSKHRLEVEAGPTLRSNGSAGKKTMRYTMCVTSPYCQNRPSLRILKSTECESMRFLEDTETAFRQILLSTLSGLCFSNSWDCFLPGRLLLPGDVERICVSTIYSHYWHDPGLCSRPSPLLSHSAPSYPHMVSTSLLCR